MNDQPRAPEERDDIARLLRLAGRRSPVPPERARRVREAARESWRTDVRSRSRRRRIGYAIGAVAACLVALAAYRMLVLEPGRGSSPSSAIVEAAVGATWTPGGTPGAPVGASRLEIGDEVAVGGELATELGGGIVLRLASGHSLRLDGSTRASLTGATTVALDRGALYVDSGMDADPDDHVEIRTDLGVVREIGTQFEVRLEKDAMRVRLREGAVEIQAGPLSERVTAGHELLLGRDGSMLRSPIAVHGSEWRWTADLAPMIGLEGRTARSFLDWVARERGWRLAFADERVALAADEIVLGGTPVALGLDDALDAVLPTCRMTYRVEDGNLVVGSMELP